VKRQFFDRFQIGRDFLEDELRHSSFEVRCDSWISSYSAEFSRKVAQKGWIGLTWPKEFGGQDQFGLTWGKAKDLANFKKARTNLVLAKEGHMAHWMCTACGYYLQSLAPPQRCPSCETCCVFNNVTCYRPECGGEDNIDPLLAGVDSMPRAFKGGCHPLAKPKSTFPEALEDFIHGGGGGELTQKIY
jgi:rubredoxin